MSLDNLKLGKELKALGARQGRAGLAERVLEIAREMVADGGYRRAIAGAGQMKALAQACGFDDYWSEKRDDGYHKEVGELRRRPAPPPPQEG